MYHMYKLLVISLCVIYKIWENFNFLNFQQAISISSFLYIIKNLFIVPRCFFINSSAFVFSRFTFPHGRNSLEEVAAGRVCTRIPLRFLTSIGLYVLIHNLALAIEHKFKNKIFIAILANHNSRLLYKYLIFET